MLEAEECTSWVDLTHADSSSFHCFGYTTAKEMGAR